MSNFVSLLYKKNEWNHGYEQEIWVQIGTCNVCDAKDKAVVKMDASEGEYIVNGVCLDCIHKGVERMFSDEPQGNVGNDDNYADLDNDGDYDPIS